MKLCNIEDLTESDRNLIFEQYKLYVEMADRISQRRMEANNFFIGVNTLLFTIIAFVNNPTVIWKITIGCLGCALCFIWYFNINSYRQLNTGKFKVIHEIENYLPLSGYAYEFDILKSGNKKSIYWPLSHVEKAVPIIFLIAYIAAILFYLLF